MGRRLAGAKSRGEGMFAEDFAGRILSFGASAAARYSEIMLSRRRVARPIEGFDALIAAIALASGATVATRDVGGFSDCGLAIVDPWIAK
jgi:predicted nucleic acid-binding protein